MITTMTLSSLQAFCISAFISSSYVGGLYISQSGRVSFTKNQKTSRDRNDDAVIRARLKAVFISTCLSCGVVYWCISREESLTFNSTLKALGFLSSKNTLKAHLLILVLYTGPFVALYLSQELPFQKNWTFEANIWPTFKTWIGFRNHIAGPVSEEIVFRACLLSIARMSHRGWYEMLFATPLWFGGAHLHNAFEIYNKLGRTRLALQRAIAIALIQFTYTTLFGAYVSFLFLRTESILPSISAHIVANVMGLPALPTELKEHPRHKLLIIIGYVIGIVGFISALGPWTS